MINRRALLKKIIYGGILAVLPDTHLLLAEVEAFMETPHYVSLGRDKFIVCIVDDPELENELEKCAKDLDCLILFDPPGSPQLWFDSSYFVAVVDGSVIDEEMWDYYVQFSNEGNIKAPCLMVGNSKHLEMPKTRNVIHFDLNIQESIQHIVSAIKTIKKNTINIHLI